MYTRKASMLLRLPTWPRTSVRFCTKRLASSRPNERVNVAPTLRSTEVNAGRVTRKGSCRVKARLITGRTVVASARRTRLGAGVVTLRPKTSRRGRRLLKRRTKVGMTLAVDVRDDQGRTTTLAQVLRFRR